MPEGRMIKKALTRIYLLAYEKTKSGVVLRKEGEDSNKKGQILFMSDPQILEKFSGGTFNTAEYVALEVPAEAAPNLFREAEKAGFEPIFATTNEKGNLEEGIIQHSLAMPVERV